MTTDSIEARDRWTITGGPNSGLQIWFRPDGIKTEARIGADRYTVRHHDHVLIFNEFDDDDPDRDSSPVRTE